MRVPHLKQHRELIRFSFLFFLGMVLGALLIFLYFSRELNDLYIQIIILENEKETLIKKIEAKDKELSLWDARKRVSDVMIHLENTPSEILKTEILRRASADTQFLIGKEIKNIENTFESIYKIFSPKVYKIDSKQYEVWLQNMVIGSKVHLFIKVKLRD
jgi:hypothetical protein